MNRRTLLGQLVAVGSAASIGGCLGIEAAGRDQQVTSTMSPMTPNCPSFRSGTNMTICANRTETQSQPVYLEPDSQTFSAVTSNQTVETLGVTLYNQPDCSLVVNPDAWFIMGRTSNDWIESAAGDGTGKSIKAIPRDTYTWSLSLAPHPSPHADKTTFIMANLEEGTYIFAVVGRLESGDPTPRIECHAQFELVTEETTQTSTEK